MHIIFSLPLVTWPIIVDLAPLGWSHDGGVEIHSQDLMEREIFALGRVSASLNDHMEFMANLGYSPVQGMC